MLSTPLIWLGEFTLWFDTNHMPTDRTDSIITNLKSGIESAKKTKTQLESLIPRFAEIVDMFSEIGKAWDSMTEGLSEVKDNYLAW